MSTGAFLEFLTGMQGLGPQRLGPGPAAEMLERRREPRLSWNCTAPPSETIQRPPRSRIGGYGSVLRPGFMILRRNKKLKTSTSESGGIHAPGACGPGLQGAWGRAPRAWGPAHQGPGAFSPQPQTSQTTIFSQTSWWEPGEGVGVG